jgi:LuxR family maltose regulon positive regulatory protein
METPLLRTKLYVPPTRPVLVPRPRLTRRLSEALDRKLTLVSAPAGFGKTTLLSEWIETCDLSAEVGWLSVDEDDNDPTRFMAYLMAAFQSARAELGTDALDAFQAHQAPAAQALLAALINQIDATPAPLLLVLDDYHLIIARAVHEAVDFLLQHSPGNLHLVIATRSEPPLHLARLRGQGQLSDLRASDLRFTCEEAAAFLELIVGAELSAEDLVTLTSRTEGWIAGLQMASIALRAMVSAPERDPGDITRFIQGFSGSHRYILDYLVEEVLQRQTHEIQAFLLQTAILDRLTGPLCDAVVGTGAGEFDIHPGRSQTPISDLHSPSQQILEHLEAANLFVMPVDHQRHWYRYHHLFADLLRQRLLQTYPDRVPTLHRRASQWYAENGLVAEAIDHALTAKDFEPATHLIEQAAEKTLKRSEVSTLLNWVDALPDELVRARPSLCLFHAWALLLAGRPLDAVQARLREADTGPEHIPGKAEILHGFLAALLGQTPRAAELSRQALQQLPPDDLFLRCVVTWSLGIAYLWRGDFAAGRRALEQAARMSQQTGNVMVAVVALCHLAESHMIQGQLRQAWVLYTQALDLAVDRQGQPLPIAGMAQIGLGELLRERGDLEAAAHHLEGGIELTQQWGVIGTLDGYIALARVRQAQGDPEGAYEAIRAAEQVALRFDATELDDRFVALHQARLWIAHSDVDPSRLEAVVRWAQERGLEPGVDTRLPDIEPSQTGFTVYYLHELEQTTFAQLLIRQDRTDEALALLEPLLPVAQRQGRTGAVVEIQVLKALALHGRGGRDRAMAELESALALAEPEGYVRAIVDIGGPIPDLLRQVAGRGVAPEYVGRLLRAVPASQPAGAPPPPRAPSLVEPLSERERQVLRLIAAGLSNREIADDLVLAVSTVKWHINNLYGKLGVRSRTQAVARAREMGLLQ